MNFENIKPTTIRCEARELLRDVPFGLAAARLLSGFSLAYFLFFCSLCRRYLLPGAAENSTFGNTALGAAVLLGYISLFPIKERITSWYMNLAQYGDSKAGPLHAQGGGVRYFLLCLRIAICKALRLLLFLLPSAICFGVLLSYREKYSPSTQDSIYLMLLAAVVLLAAAGVLVWSYHCLRYFLCTRLFYAGCRSCVRLSAKLMSDKKQDVFYVILSYLPQLLSCALILPCFVVIPRYKTAMALCADAIVSHREPEFTGNDSE